MWALVTAPDPSANSSRRVGLAAGGAVVAQGGDRGVRRGVLDHAGAVGQGVGVDVVDLQLRRELRRVGRSAEAAHRHVEDHGHRLRSSWPGVAPGQHLDAVEVEADRARGPQHAVGVEAVGIELEGVVVDRVGSRRRRADSRRWASSPGPRRCRPRHVGLKGCGSIQNAGQAPAAWGTAARISK